MKIEAHILFPCVGLGIAPFIMTSTESLLVLCFNFSLLRYGGDLAVGAMTILSSIMQFALLPLQGFTQGGQPIISYNYGAKNPQRVKKAFKLQTICCVSYSMFLWAAVELFPSAFVAVFTDDPQLSQLSCWALRIYGLGRSDGTSNDMSADIYSLRKLQEEFLFSYLKKDNSADTVYFYLASVYRRQSAGSIPGRAYSRCHRRHNDPFDVLP